MVVQKPDRVLLGVIIGAHGIRGEVKIKSFTQDPLGIANMSGLCLANGKTIKLIKPRLHKSALCSLIEGVEDRNQAELLKGTELFLIRDALPQTDDEDDFYHVDLVGLNAITTTGEALGPVLGVHNFGAGDLLEIGPHLIPFTRAHVPTINLEAGMLTVVLPVYVDDIDDDDNVAAEAALDEASDQ